MIKAWRISLLAAIVLIAMVDVAGQEETSTRPVAIGSKVFTESRLLAEIMAQLIEARLEVPVVRRFGLGGTLVVFSALREGEIDIYPEYTGTAWSVILKETDRAPDPLRAFLRVKRESRRRFDAVWLDPFGFNNSYAVAVRKETAERLGIETLSDLAKHASQLRAGWSLEFLNREDGYPGLARAYDLNFGESRGMEHGLAYEAIRAGRIDVTDAYTTDGKLLKFPIRLLADDRGYFPPYDAAPVVRADALARLPGLGPLLGELAFALPDARMQRLNFEVEENGRPFAEVARDFLLAEGLLTADDPAARSEALRGKNFWDFMWRRMPITLELTGEHLALTGIAVGLAILLAVPLGLLLTRRAKLAAPVLGAAGVIQTIPSLALLAFMIPIPWLGLGMRSAITALFLYSILPILRNTYTGIREVDADVVEAARGMGLRDRQILLLIELPLAAPTIMAGIRTAAVISVGIATLAAFIGAGGLGEPIATGLQLNETRLILAGAIPAALLAIAVDLLLGLLDKALAPKSQRGQASAKTAA